ncbi:MAG: DUF4276 family protein [Spartobacteria bacterium]|nr:DUF4276 family protein [Spartobacteria bacterium]
MVSAYIYIEGGGDSKELHIKCREGFRRLLERCGFSGRMPRLVACGGRGSAFDDFSTAHADAGVGDYIALWVDSEDPMADIEKAWDHLRARDGWIAPDGSDDEQVLLMVTCMETWIVTDRTVLQDHYGDRLQESALPAPGNMETRTRNAVQDALIHATRKCSNAYAKGKRSFEILAKLDPSVLREHLSGFVRCERILKEKLCPTVS